MSTAAATRAALRKLITPEVRRRMDKQLCASIRRLIPVRIERTTVSSWAEQKRVLPGSLTSMPGPFRWNVVPYLREIADCLSESSPVRKVVLAKAAQIGYTTGCLENFLGYIIDVAPGPAMFISADKGVAEASIELRVDSMIESAGLQGKIAAQTEKKHGKKTGDTKARKDFAGGFIMALGPRVGSKLRSFPVKYLLFDEIDAYPLDVGELAAKEGDPLILAERRTAGYERSRKIVYGSTPLIKQTSKIEALFYEGDQRYYFIPCPKCGAMQRLLWRDAEGRYRLRYERDEQGRLVPGSVYYECANPECGAHIVNSDKAWFLQRGEWRATAMAREPTTRSYHLSALYSPIGLRTWEDICSEWIGIGDEVSKLRAFVTLTLGEAFEEKGFAPRPERIKARAEGYRVGTLPEEARPLVVTIGADVQDDRIEAEVVAWGRDAESWSIAYLRFDGGKDGTADLGNHCWKEFHGFLSALHAGLDINWVLVDEGGHRTDQVRLFCEQFPSGKVLPVKGESGGGRGRARVFYRSKPEGHDTPTVMLNVDYCKEVVYSNLNKGTPDGKPPREPFPGFCHFPTDYGDDYYRMLASEERFLERTRDGRRVIKWRQIHTRNEALDCRVYAMGALYLLFDFARQRWVDHYAKKGIPAEQVKYGWSDFWQEIETDKPKGGSP